MKNLSYEHEIFYKYMCTYNINEDYCLEKPYEYLITLYDKVHLHKEEEDDDKEEEDDGLYYDKSIDYDYECQILKSMGCCLSSIFDFTLDMHNIGTYNYEEELIFMNYTIHKCDLYGQANCLGNSHLEDDHQDDDDVDDDNDQNNDIYESITISWILECINPIFFDKCYKDFYCSSELSNLISTIISQQTDIPYKFIYPIFDFNTLMDINDEMELKVNIRGYNNEHTDELLTIIKDLYHDISFDSLIEYYVFDKHQYDVFTSNCRHIDSSLKDDRYGIRFSLHLYDINTYNLKENFFNDILIKVTSSYFDINLDEIKFLSLDTSKHDYVILNYNLIVEDYQYQIIHELLVADNKINFLSEYAELTNRYITSESDLILYLNDHNFDIDINDIPKIKNGQVKYDIIDELDIIAYYKDKEESYSSTYSYSSGAIYCPSDVRRCANGEYAVRDPKNDCQFPCDASTSGSYSSASYSSGAIYCPEDLKECPNGEYVSRDPENDCEFDPCDASTSSSYSSGVIYCPSDVRRCANGEYALRDPKNDCQFPCDASTSGTYSSASYSSGAIYCTKDLKQCANGEIVARDPENDCQFPCDASTSGSASYSSGAIYCPEDLKECPNGEYVSRDPENDCEFDPCDASTSSSYSSGVIHCPKDAKQCPNGDVVSRDPENDCEFYPCEPEYIIDCAVDMWECPDGNLVARDPENDCDFYPCEESSTSSSSSSSSNDTLSSNESSNYQEFPDSSYSSYFNLGLSSTSSDSSSSFYYQYIGAFSAAPSSYSNTIVTLLLTFLSTMLIYLI